MKKKRPKFIKVIWLDHHESRSTWAEPTEPAELKAARVESRGWLIAENDECIELSAHRPLDDEDHDWGSPMRIVKSAIHFRSDLQRSDRAPKKPPAVPPTVPPTVPLEILGSPRAK